VHFYSSFTIRSPKVAKKVEKGETTMHEFEERLNEFDERLNSMENLYDEQQESIDKMDASNKKLEKSLTTKLTKLQKTVESTTKVNFIYLFTLFIDYCSRAPLIHLETLRKKSKKI
jgi:t-SNARE complex subunit (syntaxin)